MVVYIYIIYIKIYIYVCVCEVCVCERESVRLRVCVLYENFKYIVNLNLIKTNVAVHNIPVSTYNQPSERIAYFCDVV